MKLSFKTVLAAAVIGVVAVPMFSLAEEPARPAPPEGGQRGPGGPGGGQRAGGGRGMNPEQQITQLEEAVGKLTADQKTKITAIYAKQVEKMRALRDDQSVAQEDRRAKMQEMMKATLAEVRAVLTTEQHPKFDAMAQQMGPGGQRPDRKKKE
jgi:periplasmic protein CpxP/Spy